ncbi:hypothetical protein HMPREF0645_2257 [Hallella bergensis DSM 17361]|uniref:Uncharacterized protein n=1 Tax=Hallella bergensis DSM 17361 TaxID=585502 RepID=D1PZ72_9BACT|nr:hypothetical protein HMPREF0645_2257 [Hallella bergensis DSM 17361]
MNGCLSRKIRAIRASGFYPTPTGFFLLLNILKAFRMCIPMVGVKLIANYFHCFYSL